MFFLKRPLRTRLDVLKPDYGVNAYSGQASVKDYHDFHSKDRHFYIEQKELPAMYNLGTKSFKGMLWSLNVSG